MFSLDKPTQLWYNGLERKTFIKHYSDFTEEQKTRSRAAHRKWLAKNDRSSYYREYDARPGGIRHINRLFYAAKRRAIDANVPFDLRKEDIVVPETCPICLEKLVEAIGKRGGRRTSPTLDRVYPLKGYTRENTAIICKNCNSLKGHATPEELRRIADWIETF